MPVHSDLSTGVCKDVLIDLYVDCELTQEEIATIFNKDVRTIRKYLRRLGILRSRSDAVKLSWKHGNKKYNYDRKTWGKGWHYDSRGYIKVRLSKGIWKYEHILVWEQFNGRKLPEGHVVHHLNGIRDDNRIENLVEIPRKGHNTWTLVKKYQQRIRELERGGD